MKKIGSATWVLLVMTALVVCSYVANAGSEKSKPNEPIPLTNGPCPTPTPVPTGTE
jgi:hypothetical protein